MTIKTKEPIEVLAATFEILEVVDVRFKKTGITWEGYVKYYLLDANDNRSPDFKIDILAVDDKDIKDIEKTIVKIVDGIEIP